MRRLLLLVSLLFFLEGYPQSDTTTTIPRIRDTSVINMNSYYDSAAEKQRQDNNMRNLLALTKTLDERKAKEKRAALLRIGIGVGFLVILVIGLMRRRKKK
jgi:hypothetical protein